MKLNSPLSSALAAAGLALNLSLQPALGLVNVTVLPANQTAFVGDTPVFTAQATATAGETITAYAWLMSTNGLSPFTTIPGATTATCTLTNVQPIDTGYYFAKRKQFLYFYMGYPRVAQPRKVSPFGSAQAVAVQGLKDKAATKLGVILEPCQQEGHWASGWVGGLQLLRGAEHRWIAVVNASPTAPNPVTKAVWTEEPPPSLGGFAWCDEEWPLRPFPVLGGAPQHVDEGLEHARHRPGGIHPLDDQHDAAALWQPGEVAQRVLKCVPVLAEPLGKPQLARQRLQNLELLSGRRECDAVEGQAGLASDGSQVGEILEVRFHAVDAAPSLFYGTCERAHGIPSTRRKLR